MKPALKPDECDILWRLRNPTGLGVMHKEAADEIGRLRAALEPFARNVGAISLSGALGHITREHLWNARDALKTRTDDEGES